MMLLSWTSKILQKLPSKWSLGIFHETFQSDKMPKKSGKIVNISLYRLALIWFTPTNTNKSCSGTLNCNCNSLGCWETSPRTSPAWNRLFFLCVNFSRPPALLGLAWKLFEVFHKNLHSSKHTPFPNHIFLHQCINLNFILCVFCLLANKMPSK